MKHSANYFQRAFSLMEILVVVAIVAIITSICLPAVGVMRSRKLAAGGNLVVDLTQLARQNSRSKGVMTALIVVTNTADTDLDGRLFTLMELSESQWVPIVGWKTLPRGIAVDVDNSLQFVASPSSPPSPSIGELHYGGRTISEGQYAYQIFLPDGSLISNEETPPKLCLVEGYVKDAHFFGTTASRSDGTPHNYYNITLNLKTGVPMIDRP